MKRAVVVLVIVLLACGLAVGESGREVIKASGVRGGLVVHIGCGDGKLTSELRVNDSYIVHGLDTDAKMIEKARAYIKKAGRYGVVSAAEFDGKRLPYIANLVNLVVAEDLGDVSMAEVKRVLAPLGIAYIKQNGRWKRTIKEWPADIDEWQQYLHDADNNAVARDKRVGPPRYMQWVSDPAWSRSHMSIPTVVCMVSSKGRLFSIEDNASAEHPFLPGKFSLIARDAFNGIELWSLGFSEWEPITRYIKDMSMQLQRRLAAIGDTVYCTPGLSAPVKAFDAATGEVIKVYKGTEETQEFAYDEGVLYLVIGDRMRSWRYDIVKTHSGKGISLGGTDPEAPFDGAGFSGAYTVQTPNEPNPTCDIVAIDADSGREIWREKDVREYVGCTLSIRGKYAVYQTENGLFCLDRGAGSRLWSVKKPVQSGDGTEANTLILTDDMVYAKEGKGLYAYSLADGKEMWKGTVANNYEKSADIFFTGGLLWTGGAARPASYDPKTGEKNIVIDQKMTKPMGHDRCYRNFITERFYINSKTGGADFLSLDGEEEFPNHWVRGTCGMGVLPCNGLLYAPPYSCQCSIGAMIKNLNALYAEEDLFSSDQDIKIARKAQLIKGPAYGYIGKFSKAAWPTYRHDAKRHGATKSPVAGAKLKVLWRNDLGTTASAPVIADDKVFVSDVDAHTIYALDASNGSAIWDYVAGGRVDTPPTYYKGVLLFGSRDGWVHCLRASDGALAWRFKDLPDKLIGAFGQLESAWPVNGSVLIKEEIAYFSAGRSSFLDGGIFVYGLDPQTGKLLHESHIYGPFDEKTGFPGTGENGFKSDIMVAEGDQLYIRHQGFNRDLSAAEFGEPHLIPSAGFIDGTPHHRTYWTYSTGYPVSLGEKPSGDILVTDGEDFYEVRGFPVKRHSYFDPRLSGYKLFAGTLQGDDKSKGNKRKNKSAAGEAPVGKWSSDIPLTGKAMVLASDVVFVAGVPAVFPDDDLHKAYEGRMGGVLWAASSTDGKKLGEYKLDSAPAWDGMAAGEGKLYISGIDGSVTCFSGR